MYPKTLKDVDERVRPRIRIERRIVRSLVEELLAHTNEDGTAKFELAVFDGEEDHPRTRDSATLFKQLMETDEDTLYVFPVGAAPGVGKLCGWVRLVYGNDGWDVISDYHTGIEQYITETNKLCDKLENEAN